MVAGAGESNVNKSKFGTRTLQIHGNKCRREGVPVENARSQENSQGGLGSVEPNDIMVWGSASAGIHIIEVETLSSVGPRRAECRMQIE
jgi:hypothetical protein